MLFDLDKARRHFDEDVRFAVGGKELQNEIILFARDLYRKLGTLDPSEKRELDNIADLAKREMFQKAVLACGAFASYLRRTDAPADAKTYAFNKANKIADLYHAYR